MSPEIVTSASLNEEIRFARDGMVQASEWAREAAVQKPKAQLANENAFARAYVKHRENGDNDALAKQRALLETEAERQTYLEFHEGLMVAKSQLHAWGQLFESYRTLGFLAKDEIKMGGFDG